jgi:hypothetical protein
MGEAKRMRKLAAARKQYIPKRRQKDPIEIFWCGNLCCKRGEKWSFPPQVERYLREYCAGRSTLHLFGGRAKFGVRMDTDPLTQPDVIGDAFLPPFAESSFEVVILDPPYRPYMDLGPDQCRPLLMNAAWLARKEVIWFAPLWISGYRFLRLERSMVVRVADYAEMRVMQFLRPVFPKWKPATHFRRGPQIKYNRWLMPNRLLPFGEHAIEKAE